MSGNYLPKWKLEWYVADALPARESKAIAALERSDEELRGRIAALRVSDARILEEYPPAVMAGKAMRMAAGDAAAANDVGAVDMRPRKGWALAGESAIWTKIIVWLRGSACIPRWAIPAFVCAALIAVIPTRIGFMEGRDGGQAYDAASAVYGVRTKGEVSGAAPVPGLEVWRKAGDRAEKLAPEADARTGDIVQLRYIVPTSCYGALVSMDGRGVLTVHLSGNDGKAAPLTPGRPIALNTSYKLDDAPSFEAFYLITAQDNFYIEQIRRKLMNAKHPIDNGQSLSLPEKQVTAFTLRKPAGKGIN